MIRTPVSERGIGRPRISSEVVHDKPTVAKGVPMKRPSRCMWVVALLGVVGALATGVSAAPPDGSSSPIGMFVIGDGNAVTGASVTFWGAQWWKLNSVSGGSAPPSFKGFALNAAGCAGAGFTTAPGNSPPPPDGPLPAVIQVLVTSSVQKSGDTISGTITKIALVQTDPGYESNPGHAGIGTVIGLIGCGE